MDLDNKNILSLYYNRQNNTSFLTEAKDEQSMLSKAAWYIAEIIDPTGVLSWDDLAVAVKRFKDEPGFWLGVAVVLAFYTCIPSIAPVAAAAAAGAGAGAATGAAVGAGVGAVGGVGVGAAPGAAAGAGIGAGTGGLVAGGSAYTIWTIAKGVAKLGPKALKIPGIKKIIGKVLDSVKGAFAMPGVQKAGQNLIDGLVAKGIIKKETFDTIAKAFKEVKIKWPFQWRPALPTKKKGFARGVQAGMNSFYKTKEDLFGQDGKLKQYAPVPGQPIIPGSAGAGASAGAATGAGNPYEIITVQGPQGPIQTTRRAAQQAGLTPIENAELGSQQKEQPMYSFGGRLLTPQQAAALGPLAQPVTRGANGQVVPQNVPQGATQQNPGGREMQLPSQYMRPDNFNNPPTSFLNNPFGQQAGQYAQGGYPQYGGMAGGVAGMGNILGGLIQNIGMLTGQMAGTPVAGIGNIAGGLLNILPGLGGNMGGMPMPGMGFPGMGGV